jgi:thiamine transporter ThiT
MDFVKDLFVLLHLVGMAAVVGGWLAVVRAPKIIPAILWGARAQVLTGLLLVGILDMGDDEVNNAKVGVKLIVALAVAACAEIASARQKRGEPNPTLVNAAGALAVLNTAIAVLW